jgi:hypothetical protein
MYKTLGYYVTCDDALCVECCRDLPEVNDAPNHDYPWWSGFESWESPLAISESDESDSPTHCDKCGIVIEHDLTDDGYHMVFEAVLQGFVEGKQNPVVIQWLEAYEEYMQERDDEVDCEHGALDWDDAPKLYRLLPRDMTWAESDREDLRVHAYLAGWIESMA